MDKVLLYKQLLKRKYYGDTVDDIEEDVNTAIYGDDDIIKDRHGFTKGEYELTLTWKTFEGGGK